MSHYEYLESGGIMKAEVLGAQLTITALINSENKVEAVRALLMGAVGAAREDTDISKQAMLDALSMLWESWGEYQRQQKRRGN